MHQDIRIIKDKEGNNYGTIITFNSTGLAGIAADTDLFNFNRNGCNR